MRMSRLWPSTHVEGSMPARSYADQAKRNSPLLLDCREIKHYQIGACKKFSHFFRKYRIGAAPVASHVVEEREVAKDGEITAPFGQEALVDEGIPGCKASAKGLLSGPPSALFRVRRRKGTQ